MSAKACVCTVQVTDGRPIRLLGLVYVRYRSQTEDQPVGTITICMPQIYRNFKFRSSRGKPRD